MLRHFLPLTIAATLLAPLAVFAAPAAPAPGAVAPAAPARNANRVNGSITAKDATTITVTPRARRGAAGATATPPAPVVVTIGSAKIYKAADVAGTPTGTAADLTVGANVQITTDGATPPTATEIHLRAARAPRAPRTPAAPPAPAPAAPATPAGP